MPQRSAGILLYRRRGAGIEVLLVHPGGPFWARKDDGRLEHPQGRAMGPARTRWRRHGASSPRRRAREAQGEAVALGAFRQSAAKIVDVWAVEGDFDPATLKSNTFQMEWPPRSGRMREVPEVDRAPWFTPEEAARKLLKGQRPVLEALLRHLGAAAG